MAPAVAAALTFMFLLNPARAGQPDARLLHIPQPLWFHDPHWSKPALVLGMWTPATR